MRELVQRCRRSWTMALAVTEVAAGAALDAMPIVCDIANAPEVQSAITDYTGTHAGHVLKAIGVVTALCRVRSLRKGN